MGGGVRGDVGSAAGKGALFGGPLLISRPPRLLQIDALEDRVLCERFGNDDARVDEELIHKEAAIAQNVINQWVNLPPIEAQSGHERSREGEGFT